jgi:chloramphenicol O-acetyltransferase type A
MAHYLDLTNWARRDTFEFFRGYDKPYFNIATTLDVTNLVVLLRKRAGLSLTLAYHYFALRVANEIEPFRYRLKAGKVLVHDVVHCGTTVLLPNESFIMVYFDYEEDFASFMAGATRAVDEARSSGVFKPTTRDNLIHFTVFPWVSFTSFSHARNWGCEDSEPKIAFGKFIEENERVLLPISVEVHHALMDGLHAGQFISRLGEAFQNPEEFTEPGAVATGS